MARNEWASSDDRERHMLAATNPGKILEIRRLRTHHANSKALVFVDYLDQGEAIAEALDVPFVNGETRHHHHEAYFEAFRNGDLDMLVISRIGDEGIDLPNAGPAIVASDLDSSHRQDSQRAGRTMRPTGSTLVCVLTTRGASEEDFAQRRMQHLAGKGTRVRKASADDLDPESGGGDTDADTDIEDDESNGARSTSADGAESAATGE